MTYFFGWYSVVNPLHRKTSFLVNFFEDFLEIAHPFPAPGKRLKSYSQHLVGIGFTSTNERSGVTSLERIKESDRTRHHLGINTLWKNDSVLS